jgi:hypothetical protein
MAATRRELLGGGRRAPRPATGGGRDRSPAAPRRPGQTRGEDGTSSRGSRRERERERKGGGEGGCGRAEDAHIVGPTRARH